MTREELRDTETGILDVLCEFFQGVIEYPAAWDSLVALGAPQKMLTAFKKLWEHEYDDYVHSDEPVETRLTFSQIAAIAKRDK